VLATWKMKFIMYIKYQLQLLSMIISCLKHNMDAFIHLANLSFEMFMSIHLDGELPSFGTNFHTHSTQFVIGYIYGLSLSDTSNSLTVT